MRSSAASSNVIDVDGRNPLVLAGGAVAAASVVLGAAAIVGIGVMTADRVFNGCNGVIAAADAIKDLITPGDWALPGGPVNGTNNP